MNVVHAEIHPLGPEDYSVDANLEKIRGDGIRPASYSVDEPAEEESPPAAGSGATKTAPRTGNTRERVLKEIDSIERS
jgi:hypothetical protein